MSEWIASLLQRHATVLGASDALRTDEALQTLNSLQLAEKLNKQRRLYASQADYPLQVAIIGPTQSGKSTLVNFLLDSQAAAISALAGFTAHAQGYASGLSDVDLQPLHSLMQPLRHVSARTLDAESLDTYVLEPVLAGRHALLRQAVVWDTPDFDSINASRYQRAIMAVLGLTDMVVLTLSKDKYGDKSVWDLLELIQPLQRPLLVCINKLDPQDEATVRRAFIQRHAERFDSPPPPLVLLPFVRGANHEQALSLPEERRNSLQQALRELMAAVDRKTAAAASNDFIEHHRSSWLAPLHAEREANAEWQHQVQQAIERAETQYAQDYLNNPDRFDSFNRAIAELLVLLEIPRLAPVLTRTRNIVTWPARKLLGLGRNAVQRYRDGEPSERDDQEKLILQDLLNNTMVSLQSTLQDQPPTPFWRSLTQEFRQQDARIRTEFQHATDQVRADFQPEIEAAAQRLYTQLQSQPALLNSLRAVRATADAAAAALAVKSGGLAATDLILAPAMLSVTTLLTESALGKYLDTIKAELRERQRQQIAEKLLQGVLGRKLNQLGMHLRDDELYAQGLEPALQAELER